MSAQQDPRQRGIGGDGRRGAERSKVTVPLLQRYKENGRKIVAVTAYDYPSGLLADYAGMDLVLVGDSLANTALGYRNTLPVSHEEMLVALRAVARAVVHPLLVMDMPFGTYQADEDSAVERAIDYVKSGAVAIKLEGGSLRAPLVERLVANGVPVLGHIGLTPQSVHAMGGYRVQGKAPAEARAIVDDAVALEEAGVFALVLEGIPQALAEELTLRLSIPTIGIGAGVHCDGQILVLSDLLGLLPGRPPKFVRAYLNVFEQAVSALEAYRADVMSARFPADKETYGVSATAKTGC